MMIECKLLHRCLDQTIREGLSQTRTCMDRCGATEGHLIVFDRTAGKTWEEKLFRRDRAEGRGERRHHRLGHVVLRTTHEGVTVLGMELNAKKPSGADSQANGLNEPKPK